MLFVPMQIASVMTLGINVGLVLDLGHQETSLIPVYENVSMLNAWQSLPLGSKAIHRYFKILEWWFILLRGIMCYCAF